jgi:hypothetical protein
MMRKIDLEDGQMGSLCCVCEEVPAVLVDRDCGPVCNGCMAHALAAERALREAGCVEDEGLRAFAQIRRNLKAL